MFINQWDVTAAWVIRKVSKIRIFTNDYYNIKMYLHTSSRKNELLKKELFLLKWGYGFLKVFEWLQNGQLLKKSSAP
jgi:hypothetical protein